MWTPKREGKPILPCVWKDLAHCARARTCIYWNDENPSNTSPNQGPRWHFEV